MLPIAYSGRFQCEIVCIDGEVGAIGQTLEAEHGRFHPDQHRKKVRFINSIIAHTFHKLVAISAATRDALVENEYLPSDKIEIIYNGIAPLSVDEEKHEALNGRRLEALATELQLAASVIFTGFQRQPADFLSLIDIFLLPSFTEDASMTLGEAMSLGIPTVATRVGGTPEIVDDEETGFLVKSDDLKAFTRSIKNLLDQPAERIKMGNAAKVRFGQKFSVGQMVDQYTVFWSKFNTLKHTHQARCQRLMGVL